MTVNVGNMDLFTQHAAQYQRAAHDYEVDIANSIGPQLAAAKGRSRRRTRLHAWVRSVAGHVADADGMNASQRRTVASEQPVNGTVAPS
jgi:hypothetical protein